MSTGAGEPTPRPPFVPARGWRRKYGFALRGVQRCLIQELSFRIHFPVAMVVVAAGFAARLDAARWCVLVLSIALVWSAELFNSSLEQLAKAVDTAENERIRDALDMAAGAVLLVALGAALVGVMVLGPPLWRLVMG
ncbi:MAG: diacylglycerol kinase family protein [Planctomycetales bacterium]|nr:diacylglycerol kinase family protein [Planctomycetales bacterium]